MKHLALLFAFLALFSLSSCSSPGDGKPGNPQPVTDPEELEPELAPPSDATSDGRIFFDAALTPKERGAIVTSLDYLERDQRLNTEPRLLTIMKLRSGDPRTVRAWLDERVQYIVTPKTDGERVVQVSARHQFENPGVFPPSFADGANKGSIVMANLGAVFYLMGKKKGQLLGIRTDSIGTIPFSSPRAGVLMIGTGLLRAVPANQPSVVRAFQLATLLHEARHSDGNRETTGFMHAKCPAGHDWAEQPACDDNVNGPYTIDALATKAMMNSCRDCGAVERNNLRLLYLDSENRVLPNAHGEWDDAPEGHR